MAAWRAKLPAGSAWHYHKSFRQLLNYAVEAGYVRTNVAARVENPKRPKSLGRGASIEVFTIEEIEAISEEMPERWAALPIFGAGTGLRPEELFAITWDDVHLHTSPPFVSVTKAYADGELKETKTRGTWTVPLRRSVVEALEAHPRCDDTALLFSVLGKPRKAKAEPWIELRNFYGYWYEALESAGVARRTPYAMRHTYASWSIAAGIPVFQIAERMGSSVDQIRETYGHLIQGADEWEVAKLDALDARLSGRERRETGLRLVATG